MNLFENNEYEPRERGNTGGKVRYSGTEKIERRIYDDLIGQIGERLDQIADELRSDITADIRNDLQTEIAPYDRLRLIEQRLHELSKTQDGIVREIVDLKSTIVRVSKEIDRSARPTSAYPDASSVRLPSQDAAAARPSSPDADTYDRGYNAASPVVRETSADDFYRQAERRYETPVRPVGSWENTMPADRAPAEPFTGASRSASPGRAPLLFEELPASRKAEINASAARPVSPAPTPARQPMPSFRPPSSKDPFFFGSSPNESADMSTDSGYLGLYDAAPASAQMPMPEKPIFERPSAASRPTSDVRISQRARKPYTDDDDGVDYNQGCEYIIAEKSNPGSRPHRRERVISNDEDDVDIITCD